MVKLLVGEPSRGETEKNRIACNDYLRMGPGRSLAKLADLYQNLPKNDPKPPSKALPTLKKWSRNFNWLARAVIYDSEIEGQKTAYVEQRRLEALQSGLALDYERVLKLKHLAARLSGEIFTDSGEFVKDAIWLPDVKQIGSGESAEKIDIVRFNRAILEELRAILDDLAKETGGRKARSDTFNLNVDFSQLTDEQLERIANGEDLYAVLATTSQGGAGAAAAVGDE